MKYQVLFRIVGGYFHVVCVPAGYASQAILTAFNRFPKYRDLKNLIAVEVSPAHETTEETPYIR